MGPATDPLLHLCDAEGNEVAFGHDGLGLDPLVVHRAERSGTYVVRVSAFAFPPAADVKFTGGPACVYRLTLGTGPLARYAMPAGVRRGTKARVQLYDWNGTQEGRDVDATGAAAADDSIGVEGDLRVAIGDGPELTEPEARSASPPSVPVSVTGRIDHDGEEDVYRFAAKKDQRLVIEAHSVALASPMDAVLRVEDEAGKTLADDDDKGDGSDAQVQWTALADGTYRAVVGDRFSRGGTEQVYRLVIRPDAPPATVATLDADQYKVEPGKTSSIKLTVTRGADAPAGVGVVAVATDLPPGMTGTSVEIGEKGGSVTLTLSAAADAKAYSGPIRVMLLATDPKHPAAWTATASLRKDNGQELIARTDTAWLTVSPASK